MPFGPHSRGRSGTKTLPPLSSGTAATPAALKQSHISSEKSKEAAINHSAPEIPSKPIPQATKINFSAPQRAKSSHSHCRPRGLGRKEEPPAAAGSCRGEALPTTEGRDTENKKSAGIVKKNDKISVENKKSAGIVEKNDKIPVAEKVPSISSSSSVDDNALSHRDLQQQQQQQQTCGTAGDPQSDAGSDCAAVVDASEKAQSASLGGNGLHLASSSSSDVAAAFSVQTASAAVTGAAVPPSSSLISLSDAAPSHSKALHNVDNAPSNHVLSPASATATPPTAAAATAATPAAAATPTTTAAAVSFTALRHAHLSDAPAAAAAVAATAATPAAAAATPTTAAAAAAAVSFAALRHARLSDGSSCVRHLRWWLRHRLRLASSGLLHSSIQNTPQIHAAASIAPIQSTAAGAADVAGSSTASGGATADAAYHASSAGPSGGASTAATASMFQFSTERKQHDLPPFAAAAAAFDTAPGADSAASGFSGFTVEAVAAQLSHKLVCCLLLKEKSSVLLLGPPGSGKTAAVELALRTVQQLAEQQRTQRMQKQQQQEQQQEQQHHLRNEKGMPVCDDENNEGNRDNSSNDGGALTAAALEKEGDSLSRGTHHMASAGGTSHRLLMEASPASPLRCSRLLHSAAAAAAGALEPHADVALTGKAATATATDYKGTPRGRREKMRYTATATGGSGRSPVKTKGGGPATSARAGVSGSSECEIQQQQQMLPDLLIVRICCSLYPDETAMLHTIVLQLSQALHCQQQPAASASFEELSNMLRYILGDSCSVFSRAVVIILDHFEVCCISSSETAAAAGRRRRGGGGGGWGVGGLTLQHGSSSKKQQLLYCLFDLQHSSKLQLCTVCISSILDITEYMEKRIRSRFSLQTLYVAGCPTAARLLCFVKQELLLSLSPQQLLRVAADAAAAEQIFTTWIDPTAAAVDSWKDKGEKEQIFTTWIDPTTAAADSWKDKGEREADFAACVAIEEKEEKEKKKKEKRGGGEAAAAAGGEICTLGREEEQLQQWWSAKKKTETQEKQIIERVLGGGDALMKEDEKNKSCFSGAAAAAKTAAAVRRETTFREVGRTETPKRRHPEAAAAGLGEEHHCLATVAQAQKPQKTATTAATADPMDEAAAEETRYKAGDHAETEETAAAAGTAAAAADAESGAMGRRRVTGDAVRVKKMRYSFADGDEAKEPREAAAVSSSVGRESRQRILGNKGNSSSRCPCDAAVPTGLTVNNYERRSRRWQPTAQDRVVAEAFVAAYLAAVNEELSSPLFRMRFTRYIDLGRQPRFFFTQLVDHLLSISEDVPDITASLLPASMLSANSTLPSLPLAAASSSYVPAVSVPADDIDGSADARPAGGSTAAVAVGAAATTSTTTVVSVDPATCSYAASAASARGRSTSSCGLGFPLSGDVRGSHAASSASAAAAAASATAAAAAISLSSSLTMMQSSSSISPLRPAAAVATRRQRRSPSSSSLEQEQRQQQEQQQQEHRAGDEDEQIIVNHEDMNEERKTPTRVNQRLSLAAAAIAAPADSSPAGGNCSSPFSAASEDSLLREMRVFSPTPPRGAAAAAATRDKTAPSVPPAAAATETTARMQKMTQQLHRLFFNGCLLQDENSIDGLLESLSLPEHLLLGAFTRLHEQRRFPKTLHLACEQLSHLFVHRHARRQQQPHIAGLRRAFMRLLEMGLLRLCDAAAMQQQTAAASSAVAAATGDGVFSSCYLYYVPCKFPAYAKYLQMMEVLRLPGELKAWVRSFDFSS